MGSFILTALVCGYIDKGLYKVYFMLKEKNPLNMTPFAMNPSIPMAFLIMLLWPFFEFVLVPPRFRFLVIALRWLIQSAILFLIMFLLHFMIRKTSTITSLVGIFIMFRAIITFLQVGLAGHR